MMRFGRVMALALLLVAASSALAATTAGEMSAIDDDIGSPVWDGAAALVTIPFTPVVDCGNCTQGGCWSGRHQYEPDNEGLDRGYNEASHGCKSGFCSVAHPESESCGPPHLAAVWEAAVGAPVEQVFQAVDGENIVINEARQTLQVQGCNGDIILNVPLNVARNSGTPVQSTNALVR